jgi:hypothetical protein
MAVGSQQIPEIAAALAEFIAASEPYVIRFNPPLDLRPWRRRSGCSRRCATWAGAWAAAVRRGGVLSVG